MDYLFGISGYLSWPAFIGLSYLVIAWVLKKFKKELEN
jgi:hypothetical protein